MDSPQFKRAGFHRTTMVHDGEMGLVFLADDGQPVRVMIPAAQAGVIAEELLWRMRDSRNRAQMAYQSERCSGIASSDGSPTEVQQQ